MAKITMFAIQKSPCFQEIAPPAIIPVLGQKVLTAILRSRILGSFLSAGFAFLAAGTASALESSAVPGSADYMRPEGRIENLPATDLSVLQCYIFPTRPGVVYQVESSHDLVNWSAVGAEIYGMGHEQVVTLREFTPPPQPEPGSGPPRPPLLPAVHASLRLAQSSDPIGGMVVSWASLDDKRPMIKILALEMDPSWHSMPLFWNRYGNHEFQIFAHNTPIPPPLESLVLGPKDAAMFVQFETSLPVMTQEVIDNIARARSAPPPVPSDPLSRKFFRVHCDWSVDTDGDGSSDWMEFEMASLTTGSPVLPLRADAFDADTDRNGDKDGNQLDYDKDGIPDSKDADKMDGSVAFEIMPPPRYAVFPITNASPVEDYPWAIQINDRGTVLYPNGTWTGGVWTSLESAKTGSDWLLATAINDNGEIIGALVWNRYIFHYLDRIPGNMVYWASPTAVHGNPSVGEDYAIDGVQAEGYSWPVSMHLTNDGQFIAGSERWFAREFNDKEIKGNGARIWTLPSNQRPAGSEAVPWDLWGIADGGIKWFSTFQEEGASSIIYAPTALPELPMAPKNVIRLPGDRIVAMPERGANHLAQVYSQDRWLENTGFTQALDISRNVSGSTTAIGRKHSVFLAPMFINGKWIDIDRFAPGTPAAWQMNSVMLLDSTERGWVLASWDTNGTPPSTEYAAMLPIKLAPTTSELANWDGVDGISAGASVRDPSAGDNLWIMAPMGGASTTVVLKAPLNANTPLKLSGDLLTLDGAAEKILTESENTFTIASTAASGTILPINLHLGSAPCANHPIKAMVMKHRTVKVNLYHVPEGNNQPDHAFSAAQIQAALTSLFKPKINTSFVVASVVTLSRNWDLNSNGKLDTIDATGGSSELQNILNSIPPSASESNIDLFLTAAKIIHPGGEAWGVTQRDARACWVSAEVLANPAVPGSGRTQEDCMGSLLHEVGHIFVGLGHPDENDGMSPLLGTDRTLRLMHSGNRIRGGRLGTVLVKGEWQQAELWLATNVDTPTQQ